MLKLDAKLDLGEIVLLPNIAEKIEKSDLQKIAMDVCQWYQKDKDSRAKWEFETKRVIELATLEHGTKDTPYPNSSNVKYPITSIATLQFAARAYPELVRNGRVLEIATVGKDPQGEKESRAQRTSEFMNWQLLTESTEFEENLDKLLHVLPLIGAAFKKTYYDPIRRNNVSELCPYDEIFINNEVKSIETARRVTHKLKMYRNDIVEKVRFGHYAEIDEAKLDRPDSISGDVDHIVLEQHRFLDLDGDGYEEPYIVTVLETTKEVLRIIARFDPDGVELNAKQQVQAIKPIHYFTDFMYIPNPDGSYYGIGIGHLLFGSNDAINTLFNQLIDAGRFANMQTGILGRGLRIKGGELRVKPGVLMKLDTAITGPISDEIHMFDFKDPSPVLFQLLGMLIESAKNLASITDTNTGSAQVQNVAQNVMTAQIDQGTKVFTGIQRRLFRGLKKEFEKLYRLNRIFLDEQKYFTVLDDEKAISRADFEDESFDVKPIADPSMSSDAQRMQRSQALLQLLADPIAGRQLNPYEIVHRFVEDMRTPNVDRLIIPPDPNAPPPPEVIQMQSEIQQKAAQEKMDIQLLELKKQDLLIKAHLAEAEINKLNGEAELARANADYAGQKATLEDRKTDVGVILGTNKLNTDIQKEKIKADAKPKPKAGE